MKKYVEPALIGLALISYGLPGQAGGQLLVLALGGLALYYFMSAYRWAGPRPAPEPTAPVGPRSLVDIIGSKVSRIGSAVAVVGILFALKHWDGAAPMLLVGGGTLLLAGLLLLLRYAQTRDQDLLGWVLRCVLLGGLALTLFSRLPPVARGSSSGRPAAQGAIQ